MTGNETSAIASLKVTTSSQVAYSASCGNGAYAATFVVLGTPPGGAAEASSRRTSARSATPQKSGYNFTLGAGAGSGGGSERLQRHGDDHGVLATAVPQTVGTTGTRSFAVNAGNTIWQLDRRRGSGEPFGAPATPIQ